MRTSLDRTTENQLPASEGADDAPIALVVLTEQGTATHAVRERGELRIGRSPKCQIVIDDPLLSREHAVIRVGDGMEIVDLGSSNGTKVGDRRLVERVPEPLAVGDAVTLGGSVILVQVGGAPSMRLLNADGPRPIADGALERMRPLVERIAAGSISVLIVGETGVGKDVVAGMVHALSPRAHSAFMCVNCAALPEQLLEGELFGYERGAFTGARAAKPGLLESAEGGTVFLDEIGEMPISMQAALLRALDQQEVMRIGALRPRRIDVRFVAATNRDLEAEVSRGAFREDLYYRLAGVTLRIPPLRERQTEIAPLARTFAAEAAKGVGRDRAPIIDDAAIALLEAYGWPGNVRELRNIVERAVLLADGAAVRVEHLPRERLTRTEANAAAARSPVPPPPDSCPPETLDPRRGRLVEALTRAEGSQTEAARILGISRRALIAQVAKYGLPRPRNGTRP